jgi:hypothetical protein
MDLNYDHASNILQLCPHLLGYKEKQQAVEYVLPVVEVSFFEDEVKSEPSNL